MVEDLLRRMDHRLAINRPAYYALLKPGVTEAQLDAFEAQFSLVLPAAFRQLYLWRNGQDPNSSARLQYNRTFSTLADVAEWKDLLDSMIGSDFEDPRYWRRGWVPFLHNGGGSHLCLDLLAEDGGQPGQLVAFWKADEDRPIEFRSLEAWLTDLVGSMERGTLEFVKRGT
jgi:cell wall assembly regulator SMI1